MKDNNRLDDYSGEDENIIEPAEETEESLEEAIEEEIEEAEEEIEEAEETGLVYRDPQTGEKLCERCRENPVSEDETYCDDCRHDMLSVKIRWKAWLAGIASLIVAIVGFTMFLINFSSAYDVARGDYYAMKKCWQSAYNCYSDASASADKINSSFGNFTPVRLGEKITVKMIKAYAHVNTPIMAGNLIKTRYPSIEGKYSSLAPYEKEYKEFAGVYEALKDQYEPYVNGEAGFDDTLKEVEQAISKDESINKSYAYYMLSDMANYVGEDNAKIITVLKKIEKIDTERTWIYSQSLCLISLSEGDYEQCARYNRISLDYNAQDTQMNYIALMLAMNDGDRNKAEKVCEAYKNDMGEDEYYFAMKAAVERRFGSLEKAQLIVNEGLEQWDSSPEIMRQQAIINLLEGDYKAAYDSVYNAFDSAYQYYYYYGDDLYNTQQLNDTLFLMVYLYKENGGAESEDAEAIENIIASHKENKIEDSPDVSKILSGKITPEEIFTKGDGDIL